jgi:DNA polymerase-1
MTLARPMPDYVPPKRLLLFDANNALLRVLKMAKTGIELSAGGFPTAPLLFFINTLARHIRIEAPDAVIACWDGGRSQRRLALSATYKAHREASPAEEDAHFELAHIFCNLAGIQQVRIPGYEGDDLLAAYSRAQAEYITIVSDDHDLRQLIGPTVGMAAVSTKTERPRWTEVMVAEHYGLEPRHLPYLMALMGDRGDGVMGLDGIGPKKAAKLLQRHEYDWPAVLDSLGDADRATVILALQLVDLTEPDPTLEAVLPQPEPFAPLVPGAANWADMRDFLTTLQMQGVIDRLQSGRLWGVGPVRSERGTINA